MFFLNYRSTIEFDKDMAETGENVAMRSDRQAQRSDSIKGVKISVNEDQLEDLPLSSMQIELDTQR